MTPYEHQRIVDALAHLDSGRAHKARETLEMLLANTDTYHRLLRNPRTARAARLAREARR